MQPVRLRLSEFCKVAGGDNKQTVRSIIARDEAPFSDAMPEGGQRTYDAGDLLAWCLYTQLRNLGVAASLASETIRASDAVGQIFDQEARGADLSSLCIVYERDEKLRPDAEPRTVHGRFVWTVEEVAERLQKGASQFGKMNAHGEVRLGISGLVVVPVLPCVERSRLALRRAGFEAKGASLYEIEA